MMRRLIQLLILMAFALAPALGEAKTYLSQQEALKRAFPEATKIVRETVFLRPAEKERAAQSAGCPIENEMIVRYTGMKNDQILGHAYFDAHRVRTLPETIMIVVAPDDEIELVEILSFNEPEDYLPKRRWIDQLHAQELDDDLSLKRAIRPISGATLSGRAIVDAARRILAIHQVASARSKKR